MTRRFEVILTSFSSDECNGQFKFNIKWLLNGRHNFEVLFVPGTDVECVNGMFLFARPVRSLRVVHVVKPWFTSSTVGGLHIIIET